MGLTGNWVWLGRGGQWKSLSITQRCRVYIWKLNVAQLVKEFLFGGGRGGNPKVYYRVMKSPRVGPAFSQMNPVHTHTSYFFKMLQ